MFFLVMKGCFLKNKLELLFLFIKKKRKSEIIKLFCIETYSFNNFLYVRTMI